jgi:hypothetical protein
MSGNASEYAFKVSYFNGLDEQGVFLLLKRRYPANGMVLDFGGRNIELFWSVASQTRQYRHFISG